MKTRLPQSPSALRSGFARGILFRAGEAADLPTLSDIDLDAGELFDRAGLELSLSDDHEYPVAERMRWRRCLEAGTTIIATDMRGRAVGFAAVDQLDGEPYLEQLSVRTSCMRRGIGSALIHAAFDVARHDGAAAIWLTTYSHLPWNRPYYEMHGFLVMPVERCGAEILHELERQCRWLPQPRERIVMRRPLSPVGPERPAIP
jgi:GNAT superfamily N-acetyltransferase